MDDHTQPQSEGHEAIETIEDLEVPAEDAQAINGGDSDPRAPINFPYGSIVVSRN